MFMWSCTEFCVLEVGKFILVSHQEKNSFFLMAKNLSIKPKIYLHNSQLLAQICWEFSKIIIKPVSWGNKTLWVVLFCIFPTCRSFYARLYYYSYFIYIFFNSYPFLLQYSEIRSYKIILPFSVIPFSVLSLCWFIDFVLIDKWNK